ncbi:MAG: bifunctional adenosylcobinamide kinase/adenosylcobinamide-phosphate guanylyltransferase [Pseudomonadota bacterium]
MSNAHLILGGARSGKSRRALECAEGAASQRVFIATAEAFDEEMHERIVRHKQERGPGWTTLEAPLDVVGAIEGVRELGDACLIDCLTLWLSNLMHNERDVEAETVRLCAAISACPVPIFLVSNEVGLGLVPETQLGRSFRDVQGRLNQAVAAVCDRVEFIAAGLPLILKD